MRRALFAFVLAAVAAPAAAAEPKTQLPPELSDPKLAGRLADMMQALSKAFLSLPVGEVRAAAEGRQATPREKALTIRDASGMTEAELQQRIEAARPALQAGMQALARSLPTMLESMSGAREALERAAANAPRPDYPKR